MTTWLTVLTARIRAWFRGDQEDREFSQELAAHLAPLSVADLRRVGAFLRKHLREPGEEFVLESLLSRAAASLE